MGKYFWGMLLVITCSLLVHAPALAAPDRLDDVIPDAAPDQPGAFSFSWSHLAVDLEGPLTGERTAHDFFKLRYTFNPKVALAFRYGNHDLAGAEGMGLMTPLFNGMDSAQSYNFDLGLNLQYVPTVQPDLAKNVAFAAGSSFGLGLAGTMYKLDQGVLSSDETLINAYLVYSTDISPEMRAHTYFSTGRLSGDSFTGSVNRVGAGLDYALITGRRPLTLMANGVFDVYNFRSPGFTTSRISRFDFGLRYRVAKDWYTSLGWATFNDSESDQSGSGLFANINYIQQPPDRPIPECPPPAAPAGETPPAAPPQAEAAPSESELQLAAAETPPLMASAQPAPESGDSLREPLPAAESSSRSASSVTDEAATQEPAGTPSTPAEPAPVEDESGIAIPPFPQEIPKHTEEGAVMVRPGQDPQPEAAATEGTNDAETYVSDLPVSDSANLASLVSDAMDGQASKPGPDKPAMESAGRLSASQLASLPSAILARNQASPPSANGIINTRNAVLAPDEAGSSALHTPAGYRFAQAAARVFRAVTSCGL